MTRPLLLLLMMTGTALATPPPESSPNHQHREVRFDSDLYVGSDIMLQGMGATHSQGFPTPRSWELVADPEVRIYFEHSGALLHGRSSLTISVNEESVASVMLDESNVGSKCRCADAPERGDS